MSIGTMGTGVNPRRTAATGARATNESWTAWVGKSTGSTNAVVSTRTTRQLPLAHNCARGIAPASQINAPTKRYAGAVTSQTAIAAYTGTSSMAARRAALPYLDPLETRASTPRTPPATGAARTAAFAASQGGSQARPTKACAESSRGWRAVSPI